MSRDVAIVDEIRRSDGGPSLAPRPRVDTRISSGTINNAVGRIREWTFRSIELKEARAQIPVSKGARGRAARQARLLVEVARRVAEPVDVLPAGSRPPVIMQLCREAVYWALLALGPEPEAPSRDLKALWAERRPETLLSGTEPESVEAVRRSLLDASPDSLDATDDDAKRARAFAEALIAVLDAPVLRVRRLRARRWAAISGLALLLVVFGLVVRALFIVGPNLAAGRAFQTSSRWAGCPSDPNCIPLMFCTDNDPGPWVEFDLDRPRRVHRVDVTNRPDCCGDRAIPLLVETSVDRATWTEVARRDAGFTQWTAEFARTTARYVRLRVPRPSLLHLQDVEIH